MVMLRVRLPSLSTSRFDPAEWCPGVNFRAPRVAGFIGLSLFELSETQVSQMTNKCFFDALSIMTYQ